MNISPDGVTVRFKTEPEDLFTAEKSGAKPNTVRILDQDEYLRLVKANPKKIILQYHQEIFLRTITHVHATEGVFGKVIVVISWTNEAHHHAPTVGPHSVPVEPGDHDMAIEKTEVQVPPMPSICLVNNEKCTGCLGRTVKEEDQGLETASPTIDKLAPVLLPLTLIHDLSRHLRGKSHADLIRELLLEHLNKLAEEKGAREKSPNDLHPQLQTKGVEDVC